MSVRRAYRILSLVLFVLGVLSGATIAFTQFNGILLGVFVIACMAFLIGAIAFFVDSFKQDPNHAMTDDVLSAIIEALTKH